MQKVEFIKVFASVKIFRLPGEVAEVPDTTAKYLIETGTARPVTAPAPKAEKAPAKKAAKKAPAKKAVKKAVAKPAEEGEA